MADMRQKINLRAGDILVKAGGVERVTKVSGLLALRSSLDGEGIACWNS
jgi:hypothetical protein